MNKLLITALATVGVLGAGVYLASNDQHSTASQKVTIQEATAPAQQSVAQESARGTTLADYAKTYPTFDDLVQDSEIIIEGNVLEVTYFDHKPEGADRAYPKTKSKLLVTKSYNDKVKVGDVVTFLESGGVTTKKAISTQENETYLLFGGTPDPQHKTIDEPYYIWTGATQGKFKIDGDSVQRVVSDAAAGYTSLKMKTAEADRKLREAVAKKQTPNSR